jgi:Tetracyclin repressor-like, C-terminal domain
MRGATTVDAHPRLTISASSMSRKDGLVDLMLDDVIGEVPLPDFDPASGSGDWRAVLRRLELDTREMVGRHLWYAELVHTRPPLGPKTMRRTEAALAVLIGAGPGLAEALGYLALLDRHVFSSAVLAAQERSAVRAYGIEDDPGLMATVRELRDVVAASGQFPCSRSG